MRIELPTTRDDRRLVRKLARRLPTGVRIGQPARLEDAQGRFTGWAIDHPDLDEIDAIRLRYVVANLEDADLGDDLAEVGAADGAALRAAVRALRDRIDAVPEVDAEIKKYRRAQRQLELRDTPL